MLLLSDAKELQDGDVLVDTRCFYKWVVMGKVELLTQERWRVSVSRLDESFFRYLNQSNLHYFVTLADWSLRIGFIIPASSVSYLKGHKMSEPLWADDHRHTTLECLDCGGEVIVSDTSYQGEPLTLTCDVIEAMDDEADNLIDMMVNDKGYTNIWFDDARELIAKGMDMEIVMESLIALSQDRATNKGYWNLKTSISS